MSTKCRECYDATDDAVHFIIAKMDDFFDSHPDSESIKYGFTVAFLSV